MTYISAEKHVYTLINVFTVAPERQDDLVNMLVETTEKLVKHIPGFVSASFHKSLDGTRVVNYAQWENKEAFERILQNPEVRARMGQAQQIGSSDAHFYTVPFVSTLDDNK